MEITGPAELHVRSGSLLIEKELINSTAKAGKPARGRKPQPEKQKWSIPLEDISCIVCMGAGVRISSMAMAQICSRKISMMMLDDKYRPAGILSAYEANSRQSLTMRRQVYADTDRLDALWVQIVDRKIENQAEALKLSSLDGKEKVLAFRSRLKTASESGMPIDPVEAGAAKQYFQYLCPISNRREDSPINSCLNYGYSILRNSISRSIIAAGLLPSFGIHHQNLFNAYNLADDLIEPFRPCVDIIALHTAGDDLQLSRNQRRAMAEVLLLAVQMGEKKMSVLAAIDHIVDDLRSFYIGDADSITLPSLLPEEKIRAIRE